jgi:hypothetical protein
MRFTESRIRQLIREAILNEVKFDYTTHSTSDIVKAVSRALEILDIDNQNLLDLMIGIARTESGGNPDGVVKDDLGNLVITGHTKNPFQLDDITLKNIRENPNLADWRIFVHEKKGPNPAKLTDPLSKQTDSEIRSNNTLGALFATLHILWKTKNWDPEKRASYNFSGSVEDHAAMWKEHYNTELGKGKESDFITKNS